MRWNPPASPSRLLRRADRRLEAASYMSWIAWLIFIAAAVFEVAGDATIRRGLRGPSKIWVLVGCAMLAFYVVIVNMVKWDFSKMLGVYVGFFALAGVLFGRVCLRRKNLRRHLVRIGFDPPRRGSHTARPLRKFPAGPSPEIPQASCECRSWLRAFAFSAGLFNSFFAG